MPSSSASAAAIMFRCPIYEAAVGKKECQQQSSVIDTNREFCCAEDCKSPWRYCVHCLEHGDKTIVVNPMKGACDYHLEHPPKSRRGTTSVLEEEQEDVSEPILDEDSDLEISDEVPETDADEEETLEDENSNTGDATMETPGYAEFVRDHAKKKIASPGEEITRLCDLWMELGFGQVEARSMRNALYNLRTKTLTPKPARRSASAQAPKRTPKKVPKKSRRSGSRTNGHTNGKANGAGEADPLTRFLDTLESLGSQVPIVREHMKAMVSEHEKLAAIRTALGN
jgi:hypothetical protein